MAGLSLASPVALRVIKKMKEGYLNLLTKQQEAYRPPPKGKVVVHHVPYPYPEKAVPIEPVKKRVVDGIEISGEMRPATSIPIITESEKSKLKDYNVSYSLIPRQPAQGERVYAYTNIRWNRELGELVYYVVEPTISQYDLEVIENTKKILEEKLDIDFFKIGEIKAKELLDEEIRRILSMIQNIEPGKMDTLKYYMERDIVGLGKVEPLMNDPNIEDISCDGIDIPLYVYHRNPSLGSLKTNIVFRSEDELNSFVIKLSQRCKKSISIAEPLLDASLPDGSRVQVTLGTDIARKGSNFTIRKFTEQPLTPCHMLSYGTLNSTQLAYLWLAIENGQSILISGGTATGKTSMLNALSLFIRPNLKIVSIEDTPELRLPHPHWIPEVARTPLSIEGTVGEVSLFDLLKSSLRQRPDYIVMGEVRGKEAFVLFQQMATGHPSLATIHAASINQLVDRLTTPPISLPPSLIENINIIIFLVLSRLGDKYVRRANDILEVMGIRDGKPETNNVFNWDPAGDDFKINGKSLALMNISKRLGLDENELKDELARRRNIIEWMYNQGIFDYREVSRIISAYYTNPERVMNVIGEGL
jgi:flagellar protein FlaI